MTQATFLRLLDTPIAEKGDRLLQQIADLNAARPTADVFPVVLSDFDVIDGSPFAYWAKDLLGLFQKFETLEPKFGKVIRGPESEDMQQSLRLWVEVDPSLVGVDKKWVSYAKGGELKPYAADVHMYINYELHRDGHELFRRPGDSQDYFRPGVTFTQRTTSRLSFRILNAQCFTSPKGPGVIPENQEGLWYLLAIGNSIIFQKIVELKVGAADSAARSYDLHILRNAPVPAPSLEILRKIEELVRDQLIVSQNMEEKNEMSRLFTLPIEFQGTLKDNCLNTIKTRTQNLIDVENRQQILDDIVTKLYGLNDSFLITNEKYEIVDGLSESPLNDQTDELESDDNPSDFVYDENKIVSDFLMWCVGVVFGRWDVRYALNPETLPALPEPFDPLPVCSPGMLKGADGLPLDEAPKDYPLSIASHGFLVDDPDRPQDDIVAAVRRVLHLLFGVNADSIESEACQILEVPDLRAWFRDPKGFFAWHTKRYSKSRRKAPIYWLMQSAKKNYAIWLYYPRLNPDSLFYAAREYADAKLNLETARLEDLQGQLKALSGSSLKAQEKKVAAQTALVAEVKTYLKELAAAAMLQLKPDLNDGVLLNMAPLREIVPWKEPARIWEELLRGKYPWSHISAQLRKKGIVK